MLCSQDCHKHFIFPLDVSSNIEKFDKWRIILEPNRVGWAKNHGKKSQPKNVNAIEGNCRLQPWIYLKRTDNVMITWNELSKKTASA